MFSLIVTWATEPNQCVLLCYATFWKMQFKSVIWQAILPNVCVCCALWFFIFCISFAFRIQHSIDVLLIISRHVEELTGLFSVSKSGIVSTILGQKWQNRNSLQNNKHRNRTEYVISFCIDKKCKFGLLNISKHTYFIFFFIGRKRPFRRLRFCEHDFYSLCKCSLETDGWNAKQQCKHCLCVAEDFRKSNLKKRVIGHWSRNSAWKTAAVE